MTKVFDPALRLEKFHSPDKGLTDSGTESEHERNIQTLDSNCTFLQYKVLIEAHVLSCVTEYETQTLKLFSKYTSVFVKGRQVDIIREYTFKNSPEESSSKRKTIAN